MKLLLELFETNPVLHFIGITFEFVKLALVYTTSDWCFVKLQEGKNHEKIISIERGCPVSKNGGCPFTPRFFLLLQLIEWSALLIAQVVHWTRPAILPEVDSPLPHSFM